MPEETMEVEQQTETVAAEETVMVESDPFGFPADEPAMPDSVDGNEDVVGDEEPAEAGESDSAEPKQEEAATAQPTGLSEDDVKRAKDFGFTDSDIARIVGVDELEMRIGFQMRLDEQRRQAAIAARQAEEAKAEAPTAPKKFELQFSEDVADEVAQPVRALYDHLSGEFSNAQQQLSQMANVLMGPVQQAVQSLQEQYAQVRLERFDNFVNSLGPEWKDVFGEGPTDALPADSKELRERVRLFQAGEDLARGRSTSNQRMSDMERWRKGHGVEFGQQAAKLAAAAEKKKISQKLEKGSKRLVSRPLGKRGYDKSATPSLDAKMAELGITFEEDEE